MWMIANYRNGATSGMIAERGPSVRGVGRIDANDHGSDLRGLTLHRGTHKLGPSVGSIGMIPERFVKFLEQRANIAFAGTRDRDLVPHGHRVSGWIVGADGYRVTAFVPIQYTPHLIESLGDNGQFALTVEAFPSHETYQFKGRYVGHRPVQADDIEVVDRIRERFVKSVRPILADVSEPALKAFTPNPSLAVDFEVREIFLQTPGPRAGTRLVPLAES